MNTKYILLLIGLLLYAGSITAQTRFYDVTRTFHESGFTYQADVLGGMVTLYNKNAGRFTTPRQTFRDGRLISDDDRMIDDVEWETDFPMMNLAEQIVRNSLSAAERNRLRRGEYLGLRLIICSNTGNVKEVHFRFMRQSGYATIPVTTFRRMEVEIKSQVRFTPTDFGRNMNFIFRGWRIDVAASIAPNHPDILFPLEDFTLDDDGGLLPP